MRSRPKGNITIYSEQVNAEFEKVCEKYQRPVRDINEQCWILMGHRGRWSWGCKYDLHTEGKPAAVAFDPDYVWENRDKIIGWAHTHPNMEASPSNTDDITMKAWCNSLGKPLLCCIDGKDGLRSYWYMDDESQPIEVRSIRIRSKIYGLLP